jgi:ferredoxin-nitrite reductase
MTGFDDTQKQWLQGFASGLAARGGAIGKASPEELAGPDAAHIAAQNRTTAAGGKLVDEEKAKRVKHPFDAWDELAARAEKGEFPKGLDVFRAKFHGLFYVAPAQNAFMCRLRIPNGILNVWQMRGLADVAEYHAGGYADVTTRANLQLREIGAAAAVDVLTAIQDLGLTSRGSGADNIRNITGSPTAGIDPDELIDTRPLCRALHHHILNHRDLYGLPRKFNIAFDGGGRIGVLEDTNDIAFAAVEIEPGAALAPGIRFRLALGGITGHGDFARETGVFVKPEDCVAVAVAIVRAFIEHGDRTNRQKARLKYVLDRMGVDAFLAEIERHLGRPLDRAPLDCALPRRPVDRQGHVGLHRQAQDGLYYLGLVLPVGRLTAEQMRGIADIAEQFGDGAVRLTVWQNLILSGIAEARAEAAKRAVEALGLDWRASAIRAGLVACTGNTGCKFSAADTKGQAMTLAAYLERCVALDRPVNIHLTGCHHSCAQHYVGDIGLLAAKVEVGEEQVEGYSVVLGGGGGASEGASVAREIFPAMPFADVPPLLERLLKAYLAHRAAPAESFQAFCARHDVAALRRFAEPVGQSAAA